MGLSGHAPNPHSISTETKFEIMSSVMTTNKNCTTQDGRTGFSSSLYCLSMPNTMVVEIMMTMQMMYDQVYKCNPRIALPYEPVPGTTCNAICRKATKLV